MRSRPSIPAFLCLAADVILVIFETLQAKDIISLRHVSGFFHPTSITNYVSVLSDVQDRCGMDQDKNSVDERSAVSHAQALRI